MPGAISDIISDRKIANLSGAMPPATDINQWPLGDVRSPFFQDLAAR